MAIKNIEMSVYNGSSYDTLLPVTSDENVTIASAISGLFGLGADSTLTDILQKLSNAVIWDGSSTELPNGSSIVTGARIETGSYVGTGTFGASNPCSLTFGFQPRIVFIRPTRKPNDGIFKPFAGFLLNQYGFSFRGDIDSVDTYGIVVIRSGNSFSWYAEHYSQSGIPYMFNQKGFTYWYYCIG